MSSLLTLAGVYRDGKVEFAERPAGVGEDDPVLVTFLPANQESDSDPSAPAAEQGRRAARAVPGPLEARNAFRRTAVSQARGTL
jgi:hypothetical protein